MAYIARADGTREELPAGKVDYETARKTVGGYVERVAPIQTREIIFLCNEEGLLKGLPRNDHGCELYGPGSPIVGDIIVEYQHKHQCPPTIQEIGAALGIVSTNGVADHLRKLEIKGYITVTPSKARGIRLTNKAIAHPVGHALRTPEQHAEALLKLHKASHMPGGWAPYIRYAGDFAPALAEAILQHPSREQGKMPTA